MNQENTANVQQRRPLWAEVSYLKLLSGSITATLADRMYQFAASAALILAFRDTTKPAAAVLMAGVLPQFLFYPVVGWFIDKSNRKKILWLTAALRCVYVFSFIPLLMTDPKGEFFQQYWWLFLPMIFIGNILTLPFGPTRASAIPNVTSEENRDFGASLMAIAGLFSLLLGILLGGAIAEAYTPLYVIPVASGCYLLAALTLRLLPQDLELPLCHRRTEEPASSSKAPPLVGQSYLRQTMEGLQYCLKRPGILVCILFESTFWLLGVTFYLLFEWHNSLRMQLDDTARIGVFAYGFACVGLGVFLSGTLCGRFSRSISPIFSYPVSLILLALTVTQVFGMNEPGTSYYIYLFLMGLGAGGLLGRVDADLLNIVDAEYRGRVFSVKGFFFTGAVMITLAYFHLFSEYKYRAFVADHLGLSLWFFSIPAFIGAWLLDVALYTHKREVRPAGTQELIAYWLARLISWIVCKLYFRIEFKGVEKLPREGAILLAPNHGSFIDPIWAGCGLSRRVQYLMHASYYYSIAHPIFRFMNTIPVDDKSVIRAIRDGSRALEQGLCVCVFPEGHVSDTGLLQEPKQGVVFMAQKSGAPIYPVAIKGNVRAFSRKGRFPKPTKIEVEILDPIEVPRKAPREALAEISYTIMERIAEKLGEAPPHRPSGEQLAPESSAANQ